MQVKKQQLEVYMEQQTGSKLGKEYVKSVYCHPAYFFFSLFLLFFLFSSISWAKGTVRRTACMSEASLCCASGSHSRGGSKALPQKDRFSTDHSRNHPNFTLSGKQEKEPQAGGREERQKGQRGPETSS